jgi:hypothetical protein
MLAFLELPDWSTWTLLGLLVIYDAVVVLCPHGLLNIIIRTSQERGDSLPALVYSACAFMAANEEDIPPIAPHEAIAVPQESLHEVEVNRRRRRRRGDDDDDDDGKVHLGLGDFCFFGILIARAARLGWDLVLLCMFAIIMGLFLTLVFLALLKRPMPALPFSLVFGMVFFLLGVATVRPFRAVLKTKGLLF